MNGTAVGVLRANCRDCQDENYYVLGFLSKKLKLIEKRESIESMISIFPFLVIGDFIIFGLIMFAIIKLNFHFPHSLKGLLFYIQTVYYTTEHFPIAFWDVRKYVRQNLEMALQLKLANHSCSDAVCVQCTGPLLPIRFLPLPTDVSTDQLWPQIYPTCCGPDCGCQYDHNSLLHEVSNPESETIVY